jgi:hypothetical protein
MLKRNFTDGKNKDVGMPGCLFDGIPVKRQSAMIYWYSWGEHTFDIRVMRKVLGLPEENPADKWFMEKIPDPNGSLKAVMSEIQKALGARSFSDVMAEHDRMINTRELS